jgi:hypothetical protein
MKKLFTILLLGTILLMSCAPAKGQIFIDHSLYDVKTHFTDLGHIIQTVQTEPYFGIMINVEAKNECYYYLFDENICIRYIYLTKATSAEISTFMNAEYERREDYWWDPGNSWRASLEYNPEFQMNCIVFTSNKYVESSELSDN